MQAQSQSQMQVHQASQKKFCAVCKNAGKTSEEYTSHWTKSSPKPNATILCPTILNGICSYCKGKGHFKSQCSVLQSRLEKPKEIKPMKKTMEIKTNKSVTNRYAILEEEPRKKETKYSVKMEFPTLSKTKSNPTPLPDSLPEKMSYAKMAALIPEKKPSRIIEDKATELKIQMFSPEKSFKEKETTIKDLWIEEEEYPKLGGGSWDDDSFWGDEEEEDEE